jgi:hypothetical protein
MSITINFTGLNTPGGAEDRGIIALQVEYEGNTYPWAIYTVPGQTLEETIENSLIKIEQRISDQLTNNEPVVPDIPDYYAKRRNEYPPIGDQLDALWKGADSPEFAAVIYKIQQVKNQYPKL